MKSKRELASCPYIMNMVTKEIMMKKYHLHEEKDGYMEGGIIILMKSKESLMGRRSKYFMGSPEALTIQCTRPLQSLRSFRVG